MRLARQHSALTRLASIALHRQHCTTAVVRTHSNQSTTTLLLTTLHRSSPSIIAINRLMSASASARPHSPKVKSEAMEDEHATQQEEKSTMRGKRTRVKREEEEEEEEEGEEESEMDDEAAAVKLEPASSSSSSSAAAASSSSAAAAAPAPRASKRAKVKSEAGVAADAAIKREEEDQKADADEEALEAAQDAMEHAAPKEVDPERVRTLQPDGKYIKLGKVAPWAQRKNGVVAAASNSSSSAAPAAAASSSSSSSSAAMAASSSSSGRSTVIYWMTREQRVQDNSCLLYAQQLAHSRGAQLRIVFCLVPKYLEATERAYGFMLKGLKEVEAELRGLHIPFEVLIGYAFDTLPAYALRHNAGAIVTCFGPLRVSKDWTKKVSSAIQPTPLFIVDGHNVVPVWIASDKQEYAARTIRPKITNHLKRFLTDFPKVNPAAGAGAAAAADPLPAPIDWVALDASLQIDRSIKEVPGIIAGTAAGLNVLHDFIRVRLGGFATKRNDPNAANVSGLSPYLHFGQISPQRCAMEVNKYRARHNASVQSFIEELVVRRELSDNHCFYNSKYDSIEGASAWARETLLKHGSDKRSHVYSRSQFEFAVTHDPLWNAAQLQMRVEGRMHGFLRMYWAKKILEWSSSPSEALAISIYLNDRFNLDGRDPNGYVGCGWSIIGTHDIGFAERAVFGKIRYMNFEGCKRKWDVKTFIAKWASQGANPDSAAFKANQIKAKQRQKELHEANAAAAGAGGAAASSSAAAAAAGSSSDNRQRK